MSLSIQNLNALINVRQFAVTNLDNIYFKMDSSEVKILRQKIQILDKCILKELLALELPITESTVKRNEDTK